MELSCGCTIFELLGYMVTFCEKHLPIYQKTKHKFVFLNRMLPEESNLLHRDLRHIVKKLDELLTDEKELKKFLKKEEQEKIEESDLFKANEMVH